MKPFNVFFCLVFLMPLFQRLTCVSIKHFHQAQHNNRKSRRIFLWHFNLYKRVHWLFMYNEQLTNCYRLRGRRWIKAVFSTGLYSKRYFLESTVTFMVTVRVVASPGSSGYSSQSIVRRPVWTHYLPLASYGACRHSFVWRQRHWKAGPWWQCCANLFVRMRANKKYIRCLFLCTEAQAWQLLRVIMRV